MVQVILHLKSSSFGVSLLPKTGSFSVSPLPKSSPFCVSRFLSLAFVVPGSAYTQKELDLGSGDTQKEPDLGSGDTPKELDFKCKIAYNFFLLLANEIFKTFCGSVCLSYKCSKCAGNGNTFPWRWVFWFKVLSPAVTMKC